MIRLSDIFTPATVKLGLFSRDKDAVFEELVAFMTETRVSASSDEILASLRERENKMTTGIKQGIAIPHAKLKGIGPVAGALGISVPGIAYDSLDGKPVHLVFLFVSDPDNPDDHIGVLTQIGRLTERPEFFNAMLGAASAHEAAALIAGYENNLQKNPADKTGAIN
jgi:PTS system fructose-specific IIC component/PTS system nitrogen regulatory IIA component